MLSYKDSFRQTVVVENGEESRVGREGERWTPEVMAPAASADQDMHFVLTVRVYLGEMSVSSPPVRSRCLRRVPLVSLKSSRETVVCGILQNQRYLM